MPTTILLLRENSSTSLSTIVEKSQLRKPPYLEYDIQLTPHNLILTPLTNKNNKILDTRTNLTNTNHKPSSTSTDEGFESDIDSLSLVSTDDSFLQVEKDRKNENDSANGSGSSSSESDTDSPTVSVKNINNIDNTKNVKEIFNLVNCLCYTDVNYPQILIFVIKNEALVFRFDNIIILQNLFTSFTTLKAVCNQKTLRSTGTPNVNNNAGLKFNLLQRTDKNGVTHIEITNGDVMEDNFSSIISLDENVRELENNGKESKNSSQALIRESEPSFSVNTNRIGKSSSSDNILELNNLVSTTTLKKQWGSVENILTSHNENKNTPKRPERRKKLKPKAPLPPNFVVNKHEQPQTVEGDIFSGQYVRVNVNFDVIKDENNRLIIKSHSAKGKEQHPKKLQNIFNNNKPVVSFGNAHFKNLTEFGKKTALPESSTTLTRSNNKKMVSSTFSSGRISSNWTNSVPRLLKKHNKSKNETRNYNFVPLAYRYIDTTVPKVTYTVQPTTPRLTSTVSIHPISNGFLSSFVGNNNSLRSSSSGSTIGNRFFGLSPKLKDFNNGSGLDNSNSKESKWSVNTGSNEINSNLKSVIKKEESSSVPNNLNKKKNVEKKVTFSAYTTVQVV